jgi:hypothetical protein
MSHIYPFRGTLFKHISVLHKDLLFHLTILSQAYNLKSWFGYNKGLGKLMYTFSAKRLPLSTPRQASVGRASRRVGVERKAEDVWRKTYTLIYLEQ